MDLNHKENLIHKADVLMEALPYIQQFRDSVAVVKFGGSAMEDPELTARTMRDIVMMEAIGMKVVVVHGGGKAITARLKELNIETKFVNGLRFTDAATIGVVDDVLHNLVNRSLVDSILKTGGIGAQISGKKILRCEKMLSRDPITGEESDIGFVGRIIGVDARPILDALNFRIIPQITSSPSPPRTVSPPPA